MSGGSLLEFVGGLLYSVEEASGMEAIFSLERNLLEWSYYVVKSHGSVKRTCRRQCRRAFGSSPEDDGLVGQVQGVCFVRGAVRLRWV